MCNSSRRDAKTTRWSGGLYQIHERHRLTQYERGERESESGSDLYATRSINAVHALYLSRCIRAEYPIMHRSLSISFSTWVSYYIIITPLTIIDIALRAYARRAERDRDAERTGARKPGTMILLTPLISRDSILSWARSARGSMCTPTTLYMRRAYIEQYELIR